MFVLSSASFFLHFKNCPRQKVLRWGGRLSRTPLGTLPRGTYSFYSTKPHCNLVKLSAVIKSMKQIASCYSK